MIVRPVRPGTTLLIALFVLAATSLAGRVVLTLWGPATSDLAPSYLPALEVARDRYPFDSGPLEALKSTQPGIVLLGDSMALRVDPALLESAVGVPVMSLHGMGSGSAHWFLRFKNYVVASRVAPRWVVVFFRDAQLTDPTFRATGPDRYTLDSSASDTEPELNAVMEAATRNVWYRADLVVDELYQASRTREWLEDSLETALARVVAGDRHDDFIGDMNAVFNRANFRPLPAADLAESEARALNFSARVEQSVLPPLLALARAHDLRLCFVHVLRRPVDGKPAPESAALRRYIRDVRAYVTARGAAFLDDRDVPFLATLPYDDGDHILDEAVPAYTADFARRLSALQP